MRRSPAPPRGRRPADAGAHGRPVREIEFHEVKMLNKHLVRLRDEFGLRAEVLLPREVTGDEPRPGFSSIATASPIPCLTSGRWCPPCARSARKG